MAFSTPPPLYNKMSYPRLSLYKKLHFSRPHYTTKWHFGYPLSNIFFHPPPTKMAKIGPPYTKKYQHLVNNGQNLVKNGQKWLKFDPPPIKNLTLPYTKFSKIWPPYTKIAEIWTPIHLFSPPPLYTKNEPPCTTKWYFRAPLYKKWHFWDPDIQKNGIFQIPFYKKNAFSRGWG